MVNGMTVLVEWLFLSFVVEKLVEVVLKLVPSIDHKTVVYLDVPLLLALIFGLIIALGAPLDFFAMFGLQFQWPYVGCVITGLLMMGGSSLVHDVIQWVEANKQLAKASTEA